MVGAKTITAHVLNGKTTAFDTNLGAKLVAGLVSDQQMESINSYGYLQSPLIQSKNQKELAYVHYSLINSSALL